MNRTLHPSVNGSPGAWRTLPTTVLALLIALPGWAQHTTPQPIPAKQTPQDLVDALHAAFGEHHARAVHAKGILLEGSLSPAKDARTLSRAPVFTGAGLPVIVRFSDFTGIPDIPDTIGDANPRGFAIKIRAPGGDVDIVTHSFNGFPVATSDEFAVFLRAIGASGPGVAHPTPIEVFLDGHPIAKQFVSSQKPPPESYATAAYFGVNTFQFTNASGRSTHVRYRLVPHAGEHYLTPGDVKAKGPNYLLEELPQRVARTPLLFDWYAQISAEGDKIGDPSIAWPESRKLVLLGTITITRLVSDRDADRQTIFLPGTAHPGIEAADPMLTMRNNAYPISFKARQ
jgi:catalase